MNISDDSLRQLRATFVGEAEEQLKTISAQCLALEKDAQAHAHTWTPGDARLASIFREAHSLKGAARAMGMPGIEALSHRLETLFGRLQSGSVRPSAEMFDVVYQALDAIGVLVRDASGEAGSRVDVAGLSLCVEQLAAGEYLPLAPHHTSGAMQVALDRPASAPGFDQKEPPAQPLPMPESKEESGAPVALPSRSGRSEAEPTALALGPYGGSAVAPPPAAVLLSSLADESVRVSTAKLDALMVQVGELQVSRIGAEQRLAEIEALLESAETWEIDARKVTAEWAAANSSGQARNPGRFLERNYDRIKTTRSALEKLRRQFEVDGRRMAQVLRELDDDVRRTRMLPISAIFEAFPRMVRDVAHSLGKEVDLVIAGGETELDRSVLQQLKAPLTHLLRNAVDHGIETPEVRAQAGKPPTGTVRLSAVQRGDSLIVEVHDDGAGVDPAQVRSAAVQKGLLAAKAAEDLTDREAIWLIFRPGFSTRARTTDISGRGIGLDVVRENVERLHGMIDVVTQPLEGTRFTLTMPLTVATTQCLLVGCNARLYALPTSSIVRITQCTPAAIGRVEGHEAISLEGRAVLLMRLGRVLGLADPRSVPQILSGLPRRAAANLTFPVVVLRVADRRVALLVDELAGVQDVVIKSLPAPLLRVRYSAGATVLGTGEVVIVLNVADLARSVENTRLRPDDEVEPGDASSKPAPLVLVADDSITTRTLEKSILETAGYRVHVVADGEAAWQTLGQNEYDLVVSDVSMPRVDGFELTSRIRGDARLKNVPVVLVTSLDSIQDRERGVQVGADAYILKGTFDQGSFLAAVERLTG